MLEIQSNNNPDIDNVDRNLLEKNTCRYCFDSIDKNFSTCLCQSTLCKDCLEQELIMTSERSGKQLKCTVCKQEYKIKKNKKFVKCREIKKYLMTHLCLSRTNTFLNYPIIDRANGTNRFQMWCFLILFYLWNLCSTFVVYFVNYYLIYVILLAIRTYGKKEEQEQGEEIMFYGLLVMWILGVWLIILLDFAIYFAILQLQKYLNYPAILTNSILCFIRILCISVFWNVFISKNYDNLINHITSILYMVTFLCSAFCHIICSIIICWARIKVYLGNENGYYVNELGPVGFITFEPTQVNNQNIEDNIVNSFQMAELD